MDEGIPKHVLAGEHIAGGGLYKTTTATGANEEILIADAFYAFFLKQTVA